MNKSITLKIIILLLSTIYSMSILAQNVVEPNVLELNKASVGLFSSWSVSKKTEGWFLQDKLLHAVYQYDGSELSCYDYVKGEEVWRIALPGFKAEHITAFASKPFIKFEKDKLFSFPSGVAEAVAVSRRTGEILFSTENIPDYEPSEIVYSIDQGYVLHIVRERIKRDKEKGAKGKTLKHLSLYRMGNPDVLWTETLPDPETFKLFGKDIKKAKTIGFPPLSNGSVLTFSYAGALYGYDITNGSILWKHKVSDLNIRELRRAPSDNEKVFVSVNKPKDGSLSMDLRDFSTGEIVGQTIDLGWYYELTFKKDRILVNCGHGFNYLNYKGDWQWKNFVPTLGKILEIYEQDDGHLIIEQSNKKYFANWVRKDGTLAFDHSVTIKTPNIRDGRLIGDDLFVVTDSQILLFNINQAVAVAEVKLDSHEPFSIDPINKTIIYSKKGKQAFVLKSDGVEGVAFNEKRFFEKSKDTISRIHVANNRYSLISKNEMVQYDSNGTEVERIFYKPKSNILKVLVPIAALVAATIFSKEADKLNRVAYKSGLKNSQTQWDEWNFLVQMEYYGVGDLGRGLIAYDATRGLMDGLEREIPEDPYEFIDRLWMVRDKFDDGDWGLRIVDLEKGKEVAQFPIGPKDFSYDIDVTGKILFAATEKEIKFFPLPEE